jgi:hypothetical protein
MLPFLLLLLYTPASSYSALPPTPYSPCITPLPLLLLPPASFKRAEMISMEVERGGERRNSKWLAKTFDQ